MKEVIILAKTRMKGAYCIGGMLSNGQPVRLLNSQGFNQDMSIVYKIGEVYSITYDTKPDCIPPHVEDIMVRTSNHKYSFPNDEALVDYLINKLSIKIWRGSIENLFDNKLEWTSNGSGYVSKYTKMPDNSAGFWISDKDLIRDDNDKKIRYRYADSQKLISFVGLQEPVDIIPAGTLIRVSLARWWTPNEAKEKRCYLQLSGWYDLAPEEDSGNSHILNITHNQAPRSQEPLQDFIMSRIHVGEKPQYNLISNNDHKTLEINTSSGLFTLNVDSSLHSQTHNLRELSPNLIVLTYINPKTKKALYILKGRG